MTRRLRTAASRAVDERGLPAEFNDPETEIFISALDSLALMPEDSEISPDLQARYQQTLSGLPELQRRMLLLSVNEGLRTKQIAEQLQMSPVEVQKLIREACEQFPVSE